MRVAIRPPWSKKNTEEESEEELKARITDILRKFHYFKLNRK